MATLRRLAWLGSRRLLLVDVWHSHVPASFTSWAPHTVCLLEYYNDVPGIKELTAKGIV